MLKQILLCLLACIAMDSFAEIKTVCNPIDISYRFMVNQPSRREGADPTVVRFNGTYYLFVSKSGGYWHSKDMVDWAFIQTNSFPTEGYAPSVHAIDGALYMFTSGGLDIYKTTAPMSGKWELEVKNYGIRAGDPALFLDDDKRLYLYWGTSNKEPIWGIELDYKNHFKPIGTRKALLNTICSEYGWEVRGDYNSKYEEASFLEGAWVNKWHGKYYLQYSVPGTQFASYCDAVYISDAPLGPYKLCGHNPFSYKPSGFTTGAGHGSTIKDEYGNLWHYATTKLNVIARFERRIGMYPTFLDKDGNLHSCTKFGDYPMIMPKKRIESFSDIFPGWMLLTYEKSVEVSSCAMPNAPEMMVDENIRTSWSAKTGNDSEWALVDLGESYDVYAVQLNFAEHNTEIYGRKEGIKHRYILECSNDKSNWKILVDKSENKTDNTHNYHQLANKVKTRYLRVKNIEVPGGSFGISGFRVFGLGSGAKPKPVTTFDVLRHADDRRAVSLKWKADPNATGYNVTYGIAKDKLYLDYIVLKGSSLTINSLDVNQNYYFTIEAFNENGVTPSPIIKKID